MNNYANDDIYRNQIEWHNGRAMLLDIHDNVALIINQYAIELLVILERFDKAAQLRRSVLQPLESGDYVGALDGLRDFVLADDAMFKLFPQLVDRAEPGLWVLNEWSAEYDL